MRKASEGAWHRGAVLSTMQDFQALKSNSPLGNVVAYRQPLIRLILVMKLLQT
jgi:hypothetical protein